jgi:phosphoribosylformimino-5-aminoimidazole carboxamide ribotide isomerase
MNLYPAIDLKDGKCVRLLRGEMDAATTYNPDPAAQGKVFEEAGFGWLHIVDLNGAFEGRPVNAQAVKSILKATSLKAQLGGGIRDLATISRWLEDGIERVILGTVALKNPAIVMEACHRFPGQIAVGIDAKNGLVATDGWAKISNTKAVDLARRFEDAGVSAIIYTDINRDGALEGPNLEETAKLAEALSIPVILSGGMSSPDDLKAVMRRASSGIEGVILGRALYDGRINAKEALKLTTASF